MIAITASGEPRDWIVKGGRPAAVFPDGLPSFEHEDSKLAVLDLLIVQADSDGQVHAFPSWYGTACVIAPEGPVPLHHDPDAWWKWRPVVYRVNAFYRTFIALGSQQELQWRFGLWEIMGHLYADAPLTMPEADERADALLHESLSPQQRIELAAEGNFRVRGASGSMYRVRIGDGFELVSPWTGEPWISFCLHPEQWMPNGDVALATMLMLEDEALEQEMLGNASSSPRPLGRPSTVEDRYAKRLEEELIA